MWCDGEHLGVDSQKDDRSADVVPPVLDPETVGSKGSRTHKLIMNYLFTYLLT